MHPFDAVDVRFGANLLGLAHLDDFDVLDVGFPMLVHDVLSSLMLSLLMSIFCSHIIALDVRGYYEIGPRRLAISHHDFSTRFGNRSTLELLYARVREAGSISE